MGGRNRSVIAAMAATLCLLAGAGSTAGAAGAEASKVCPVRQEPLPPAPTCRPPGAPEGPDARAQGAPAPGAASLRAFRDPVTGRLTTRPAAPLALSPDEERMLSRSTSGLVSRVLPGGAIALDLQGRFMNLSVARRKADGSIATSCIHGTRGHPGHVHPDPATAGGPVTEAGDE